jgi:hypothetical protein
MVIAHQINNPPGDTDLFVIEDSSAKPLIPINSTNTQNTGTDFFYLAPTQQVINAQMCLLQIK